MEVLLTLATISVIGVLIASTTMRRAKRADPSSPRVLEEPSSGFARVRLPEGWAPDAFLPYGTSLQAMDALRRRFCLVISEPRGDFDPAMDLSHHAARTLEFVTRSAAVVAVSGPEARQVGGFDALQYEVEASTDTGPLVYLHTTIAGNRAFHQVLCWSARATYDRGAFERLLDGFTERPSSMRGETAAGPQLVYAVQPSTYEVH